MIPLTITADLEKNPWTDIDPATYSAGCGHIARIGRLPRGTQSGLSTIAILVEMPDGRKVIAQTTMRLFQTAAGALRGVEDEANGSSGSN